MKSGDVFAVNAKTPIISVTAIMVETSFSLSLNSGQPKRYPGSAGQAFPIRPIPETSGCHLRWFEWKGFPPG